MASHWLTQSFIAVLFLTPAWLAMPFFAQNYGVPASVFAVWYFLGTAISIALFGVPSGALIPSVPLAATLLFFGFVIGGVANLALFSAVVTAPNPGLPVAISTVASLTTFLVAIMLARYVPTYFAAVQADFKSLAGVVLIIAGAALIAIR